MSSEKLSEDKITAELNSSFARWDYIKENGSNDPGWYDGHALNLVRNHIINDYIKLDKLSAGDTQLSMFDTTESERRPIPPEVPNEYMARPDELVEGAKKTLAAIEQDENYIYLSSLEKRIPKLAREKSCYDAIVGYARKLAANIEKRYYPSLRGYQDTDYWIKSYADMRKRVDVEIHKVKTGFYDRDKKAKQHTR